MSLGADPHFIRRRLGGEPGTEIDRIAGDPIGPVAPISHAGHDEPGVDAAMQPKRLADAGLELGRHVSDHSVERHRRPHRAHRIVLVSGRDAEQGENLIPDELVDDPAMRLDDAHRLGFDAPDQARDHLRVEPFVHCRVAREVGEQHRRLASLALFGGQRNPERCIRGKLRRCRQAFDGAQDTKPVPGTRNANVLQHLVRNARQQGRIDVVRLERIGVLGQAKSLEPVADGAHRALNSSGASARRSH